MKKALALILALVCVFALCACGSSAAPAAAEPEKEVLIMGTSADYAPFEFMYPDEKGELVYGGIDVSVGQYIADYTGKELKVENMGFDYLLVSLTKGDFDIVLAAIEETEERLQSADFSDPYIVEVPEKILVRAEDAEKFVNAAEDFQGVSVGAQTGSTKVEKAEQNLTGCTVVSLPLVTDLVNELVNGKIDAVVLDGSVAASYDAQYDQLVVAEQASGAFGENNEVAVAVAKGDPKGLLPGINEAIEKLLAENKIEEFKAAVDEIQGIEEVSADAPEGYEPDED